jgi:hypothetical protein
MERCSATASIVAAGILPWPATSNDSRIRSSGSANSNPQAVWVFTSMKKRPAKMYSAPLPARTRMRSLLVSQGPGTHRMIWLMLWIGEIVG